MFINIYCLKYLKLFTLLINNTEKEGGKKKGRWKRNFFFKTFLDGKEGKHNLEGIGCEYENGPLIQRMCTMIFFNKIGICTMIIK